MDKLRVCWLYAKKLLGPRPSPTKAGDMHGGENGRRSRFTGDAYVCIKSQAKYVPAVRGVLNAVCAGTDLSQQDTDDIKLAVGEAVCNAIEHGSPNGGNDYICVSFAVSNDGLTATISDGGGRLTQRSCRQRRQPQSLQERGYGLLLIQKLSSAVRIRSSKHGTTVTLEKRFPVIA